MKNKVIVLEDSRELFVKAFMEAERIDNSNLKNEEEIEWDFSKKFESSMNKLIKRNNHIKLSTRRNIKKGLLIVAIVTIVAFTGLMSVSATRTPFIEFIKKTFPQFNEITLSEESTPPVDKIETEYTLTNLPEGFEIKEYQKDDLGVFVIWRNDNNEEIVFGQDLLDSNFTIDTEHGYEELYINGYKAYYYASQLKWTDGVYWFTLGITNGNKSELLKISKNISVKK